MELTFSGNVDDAKIASDVSWTEPTTSSYWTFQGVYYNYVWEDGNENLGNVYGFAANDYDGGTYTVNPGDFVKALAGASIAPFRAFLQFDPGITYTSRLRGAAENNELPSSMTVCLVGANGQTTAIGSMDTKTGEVSFDSDTWYSLDGRKLSGKPSTKGIYIHNGKMVIR